MILQEFCTCAFRIRLSVKPHAADDKKRKEKKRKEEKSLKKKRGAKTDKPPIVIHMDECARFVLNVQL